MKHFVAKLRGMFVAMSLMSLFGVVTTVLLAPQMAGVAHAVTNPQSGSVGITGTIGSAPPKNGATIASPSNGQNFTNLPVTVSGLCPTGLLVKIFDNNVFVGSVNCTSGSYSIQIDLFDGRNDIVARVFDALDQAGPDSNIVTVTFSSGQFNQTNSPLLTLTSDYARRGANPGDTLVWPMILSGGTGPYAISIDWGDGKSPSLISEQFPGVFDAQHVYDTAGVYSVIVKATDKNGLTAYLQLVGLANGAITQSATGSGSGTSTLIKTKVLWEPAAAMLPLILITFWLGRRYELASLRKHLEREEY